MKNSIKQLSFLIILLILGACNTAPKLGIFEGNNDIGNVKKAGSVKFNYSDNSYTISGGGSNMWGQTDELHYAWKKMTGDVSIAADITWVGTGGNAHREACMIISQSLEPCSAYADAAFHGDGLTSIQYREVSGEITREIQSSISAPKRVRIEKDGDYLSMSIDYGDGELKSSGGTFKLPFTEPFCIGLGVCAHNNDTIETAIFSNVVIETIEAKPDSLKKIESTLETIPVSSFDRRVVYHTQGRIEAPNWSPDGKYIYFNSERTGTMQIWRMKTDGSEQQQITTDEYNDWFAHPSPDGKWIAYISFGTDIPSGSHPADKDVMLRLMNLETKDVQVMAKLFGGQGTINVPSWSPDSKRLAFVSYRLK